MHENSKGILQIFINCLNFSSPDEVIPTQWRAELPRASEQNTCKLKTCFCQRVPSIPHSAGHWEDNRMFLLLSNSLSTYYSFFACLCTYAVLHAHSMVFSRTFKLFTYDIRVLLRRVLASISVQQGC